MLRRFVMSLAISAAVSGCSVPVTVSQISAKVPNGWHESLPHGGSTVDLDNWWNSLGDRSLSALIALSQEQSPTLGSALASIDAARATLASSRAGLFPTLNGSADNTRSGGDDLASSTVATGILDASWEVDLFGKTRQTARAADLRVRGAEATWHDTRVSLAAEVADTYAQYRACRLTEGSYRRTLGSQQETLRATEELVASGISSDSDLLLAKGNAANASLTLTGQTAICNVLIKSLSQLSGGDEAGVRAILAEGPTQLPQPRGFKITSLPADLLRQRPDVLAAEAELAARLAEAGASAADLYPSLSLGGTLTLSGGVQSWSYGPALSLPIFNGGTKRAALAGSKARYAVQAETYRAAVLSAVADVERDLTNLNAARRKLTDAQSAASNLMDYFLAVDTNWKAGGISLIDREDARRSAQSAEITLISVRLDVLRQWIALYKSLGGGWPTQAASAPPSPKS